jgi:hypothetical protein
MAVTTSPGARVGEIARLINSEFDEMPGMRLTAGQVRRLWNLTDGECEQVLDHLREAGCLARDRFGRYARRDLDY